MNRGEKLPLVLEMAASQDGLTNASYVKTFGGSSEHAGGYITKCCERGHLHSAKRQGHAIRWFDTAQRAADWEALPGRPSWKELRAEASKLRSEKRDAELAARRAAQRPETKTALLVVDDGGVRRITDITKRPNVRWQALELPPDPRWPSFASVPLGVNPDTGKAWGAPA